VPVEGGLLEGLREGQGREISGTKPHLLLRDGSGFDEETDRAGPHGSQTRVLRFNDDPQAQLDSNQIPFIAIPRTWSASHFKGIQLGDLAIAFRKSNGLLAYAIVGDLGPARALGEGSVALHKALGNDPFVSRSGKRRAARAISSRDVFYLLFPGRRQSKELVTSEQIEKEGAQLLAQFGGRDRLRACATGIGTVVRPKATSDGSSRGKSVLPPPGGRSTETRDETSIEARAQGGRPKSVRTREAH
jgi:hypothetical protein